MSVITRSSRDIACRIVTVQLLLARWGVEAAISNNNGQISDRISQAHQAIAATFNSQKIYDYCTKVEYELLCKELGGFCTGTKATLSGRWESLGVLLWSANLTPLMPPYWTQWNREELFRSSKIVPAMAESVANFISRNADYATRDVREELNRSEAWYWRSRCQVLLSLKSEYDANPALQKDRPLPRALTRIMQRLPDAVHLATERCLDEKIISQIDKTDFDVGGIPYSKLSQESLLQMGRIAENRMSAFGWLCGNEWDVDEENGVAFVNPMSSVWSPVQ